MKKLRVNFSRLQSALVAFALATGAAIVDASPAPDLIYVGTIRTMNPAQPLAEAVAVSGSRIVAVGGRREILQTRGDTTRVVELGKRAMLPGFIDAHGHLTGIAAYREFVNLAPPPSGRVSNIATLQAELRQRIAEQKIPEGEWVVGVGYDDSLLDERRHPTRDDLDVVSTKHPVIIVHASGHLSVGNSRLLDAVGVNSDTNDPPGGVYRRREGSREPNGVFEEIAHYAVLAKAPRPSGARLIEQLSRTLSYLASQGLTTVQDGAANPNSIDLLQQAASMKRLDLDVVAYRLWSVVGSKLPSDPMPSAYVNRLRVDGVKIILDGSPQGKTAFLSAPYRVPPEGRDASYRGYPSLPELVLKKAVEEVLARGIPLLAHANGDAAAEMLINAVADSGVPSPHSRVVMIHAQTVRDDQLDRMAKLGITPSFFVAHTFFWGDWHRDEVLGEERAKMISPLRSAEKRGIRYTLHNDPPVVPPDMIRTLWAATNRVTRSGKVLGADQRATIGEALAAITIDAARQYGEEAIKGSIEPGKQADFVVLSADPFSMPIERLLDLKVVETVSQGRSVYAAQPVPPPGR